MTLLWAPSTIWPLPCINMIWLCVCVSLLGKKPPERSGYVSHRRAPSTYHGIQCPHGRNKMCSTGFEPTPKANHTDFQLHNFFRISFPSTRVLSLLLNGPYSRRAALQRVGVRAAHSVEKLQTQFLKVFLNLLSYILVTMLLKSSTDLALCPFAGTWLLLNRIWQSILQPS